MSKLMRHILSHFHSMPLQVGSGAYFPLTPLCDDVFALLSQFGAVGVHPLKRTSDLTLVLSWDNRQLHSSNKAFYFCFTDVILSQSSIHVHDFAIIEGKEDNNVLRQIASTTGMNHFIPYYPLRFAARYSRQLQIISSAD